MNTAKLDQKKQNIIVQIIKRFSRGSVNLQRGRFATEEEIRDRKAVVTRHNFLATR